MDMRYVRLPKNIKCPVCELKHFFVRPETKKFMEDKLIYIKCECGVLYKVVNTVTSNPVITVERNVYADK